MTVGIDTYITLEEANTYISTYYVSTDPLRINWDKLENADKEVYLRNGSKAIDSLVLLGKRASKDQKMEFPRQIDKVIQKEVPDKVKFAQVETALSSADPIIQNRQDLINAGVVSYRIGDLSETYKDRNNMSVDAKLYNSSKAVKYLTEFIGGTYNVI